MPVLQSIKIPTVEAQTCSAHTAFAVRTYQNPQLCIASEYACKHEDRDHRGVHHCTCVIPTPEGLSSSRIGQRHPPFGLSAISSIRYIVLSRVAPQSANKEHALHKIKGALGYLNTEPTIGVVSQRAKVPTCLAVRGRSAILEYYTNSTAAQHAARRRDAFAGSKRGSHSFRVLLQSGFALVSRHFQLSWKSDK